MVIYLAQIEIWVQLRLQYDFSFQKEIINFFRETQFNRSRNMLS